MAFRDKLSNQMTGNEVQLIDGAKLLHPSFWIYKKMHPVAEICLSLLPQLSLPDLHCCRHSLQSYSLLLSLSFDP